MTNIINKTIYLKATKAQVWAYLTDPEKLAIWFHKPTAPLTEGKDYAMHGVQSGDKVITTYSNTPLRLGQWVTQPAPYSGH